jgi:hypothetical protein
MGEGVELEPYLFATPASGSGSKAYSSPARRNASR